MSKTTLISTLVVIVILSGLAWFSQGAKNPNQLVEANNLAVSGGEDLTVSEKSFDFGPISMRAGVVSKDFIVKNNSSETLNFKQVYTSCMCTTATLVTNQSKVGPFGMLGHGLSTPAVEVALAPNEELKVRVIFDPAAHGPAGVGKISRTVTLVGSNFLPVELEISALVRP